MNTNLYVVHTDAAWLQIAFITVVIRNSSVTAKYPGGIRAYCEKYRTMSNNQISVSCSMGDEVDEVYMDLKRCGLKQGGDFTALDVGELVMEIEMDKLHLGVSKPRYIAIGVPWLKCRYTSDGIFVRYTQ